MAFTSTIAQARASPRSPHVSDSFVQPFLQPEFDPVAYFNTTLPALSLASTASSRLPAAAAGRSATLPELSSQLQTLLAQLNAQTSRLSNVLTQLTDEIIRNGTRLAYEVDVLRSETGALSDTLTEGLHEDLALLAPSIAEVPAAPASSADAAAAAALEDGVAGEASAENTVARLRTLTQVRGRLDLVIRAFGAAMQWPLAPSEVSLGAALISVSAPDASAAGAGDPAADGRSREERGQAHAAQLREELQTLLAAEGPQAAVTRVAQLRALAEVWKGTAEAKARLRQVEALQKLVDDAQQHQQQQRTREKAGTGPSAADVRKPGGNVPVREQEDRSGDVDAARGAKQGGGAYGFLQNLRNLKNEVYLE